MKSPLITMSAITGNPTNDEIFAYMASLNKNGIEQVMLYPRSGCEIDYLSDEWFEKIGEFIKAAGQLDMNIWIYDEFNWPSGHAGSRVTDIEEFRLKSIFVTGNDIGKINFASTLSGSLFNERFFPDLLSEKAVDYFMECTHEKYYEKYSAYFGNVIKGFFTDEPAVAYCCTDISIPYYDGMEDDYSERFKRSFSEDIKTGNKNFYKNTNQLIADRFNKCYITKIKNWCEAHNVLLTGHLMQDHTPKGATRQSGDYLKNLLCFSVPGIDEIDTDFCSGYLLTLFGGAEYASGENGAMAELFALGPCDMPYAVKRCMIYLAACFKINHYFLAVSHMDIRGNQYITDYFNDFSENQPDFAGMPLFSEEAKRAAEYAVKDYEPDVYIRYPKEICAGHITDEPDISPFFKIADMLSFYQLQWKLAAGDDNCQNTPVIDFTDNMEYVLDGIVTADAHKICSMIKKDITVTCTDGSIPRGIFVRKFNDGSVIVLNLYGTPGVYKLYGREIRLEKHGVYVSTYSENCCNFKNIQTIKAEFKVNYANENMIRAMYVNSESRFKIYSDSCREVCFAVRKDAEAYLNGDVISCISSENKLPAAFSKLYNLSENICLEKGENILESSGDFKYLPSVFVTGEFSAQVNSDKICSVTLNNRKTAYIPGEYFSDFGKAELSVEVYVPEGAKALEIKESKAYTCLSIDGVPSGEKICAPYIFAIDEALQGKRIRLSIVQYSSLGPVFADVDYFDKNSEAVKWKNTPVPENDVFGFKEINWIFDEEASAC